MTHSEDTGPAETAAIERAIARGERHRRELVRRCGGLCSVDEVAEMTGMDKRTLQARIEAGTLIFIQHDGRSGLPGIHPDAGPH